MGILDTLTKDTILFQPVVGSIHCGHSLIQSTDQTDPLFGPRDIFQGPPGELLSAPSALSWAPGFLDFSVIPGLLILLFTPG